MSWAVIVGVTFFPRAFSPAVEASSAEPHCALRQYRYPNAPRMLSGPRERVELNVERVADGGILRRIRLEENGGVGSRLPGLHGVFDDGILRGDDEPADHVLPGGVEFRIPKPIAQCVLVFEIRSHRQEHRNGVASVGHLRHHRHPIRHRAQTAALVGKGVAELEQAARNAKRNALLRVLRNRNDKVDVYRGRGLHPDLDRRAFVPFDLRALLKGSIRAVERKGDQVMRAAAQAGQHEPPGGIGEGARASGRDHDLSQRRAAVRVENRPVDRAGNRIGGFIRPRTDRVHDLGGPVHVHHAVADGRVCVGVFGDARAAEPHVSVFDDRLIRYGEGGGIRDRIYLRHLVIHGIQRQSGHLVHHADRQDLAR